MFWLSPKLRPNRPQKLRSRNLRHLNFYFKMINISNSSQFLSPNVLWSCNVHRRQQPEGIKKFFLFRFVAVASSGYKTGFNLNNILAPLSVYFFRKRFTSKCHHHFKPCSFSLFDRRNSDKLEKINVLLLSGCRIPFKKKIEGSEVSRS